MLEAPTFLCQRGVGLVLVHQQLDLFCFEGRVEDLVQARVSLFAVDELRHLLYREVGTTLRPSEVGRDGGERKHQHCYRGGGKGLNAVLSKLET